LRKAMLLASARITPVWDAYFPFHRMDDWRLRCADYRTGAFEREVERSAAANKKRKAPNLQPFAACSRMMLPSSALGTNSIPFPDELRLQQ
jgi:hypothetical protein